MMEFLAPARMQRVHRFFLFGILLAAICGAVVQTAQAQRGNPTVALEGESIDQMIGEFMQEHQVPGMTLAIVQAPYISRVIGYGVADREKGLLASPKTLWDVGELTQAYTAVAIMQLVETEKLRLDDTLGRFFSDLPAEWLPITLRQLMSHVSGLPDYSKTDAFDPAKDYQPDQVLELVRKLPLSFKPGTSVTNSATDFFLLGRIVVKASGMSYEAFVTINQIERLGLKNTMFASSLKNLKQEPVEKNAFKHKDFLKERVYIDPTEKAAGYQEKQGVLAPAKSGSMSALYANGAVLASAEDISLWDIGLAGGLLVSEKENRDFLYNPARLSDGTVVPANCGWRFPKHKGLMDIQGRAPGFSSYLSRFTDKSELLCVTLCANKDGLDLSPLARKIAGAFDRKLGPPVSPKVMACRESCYSVDTTMNRLETFLRSRGVDVAARVNHSEAASKKNLELAPAEVLIFGNPAVGTKLMQNQPGMALELPLRVAVWQEKDGTVWVGSPLLAKLAERFAVTDQAETVAAMNTILSAAIAHATAPY